MMVLYEIILFKKTQKKQCKQYFSDFLRIFQFLNPLTINGPHHIKTSQLICIGNQLTGFDTMENIGKTKQRWLSA